MSEKLSFEYSYSIDIYRRASSRYDLDFYMGDTRIIWRSNDRHFREKFIPVYPSAFRRERRVYIISRSRSEFDFYRCDIYSIIPKSEPSSYDFRRVYCGQCGDGRTCTDWNIGKGHTPISFAIIRGIERRIIRPFCSESCRIGISEVFYCNISIDRRIAKIIDDISSISIRESIIDQFFIKYTSMIKCRHVKFYISEECFIFITDIDDISGKSFSSCNISDSR